MKTLFSILFGALLFFSGQISYAQNDSIRIIAFDHNVEFGSAMLRKDFVDYVLGHKNPTLPGVEPNCVDTMIVDSIEIINILSTMDNLSAIDSLPYTANQFVMEGRLNRKGTDIRWSNFLKKTIDNRILFVLFSKPLPGKFSPDHQEFVWSDGYRLDKGYYRYLMPQQLIDILKKYTHLFD